MKLLLIFNDYVYSSAKKIHATAKCSKKRKTLRLNEILEKFLAHNFDYFRLINRVFGSQPPSMTNFFVNYCYSLLAL